MPQVAPLQSPLVGSGPAPADPSFANQPGGGISSADMAVMGGFGVGQSPVGGGMALPPGYAPPPQASGPKYQGYFAPSNMYTPYIKPGDSSAGALKKYFNELEPTSLNVRNLGLSTLLGQLNTPMQSLYLSQGQDAQAQGYGQQQGALASAMASRGLIGSGAAKAGSEQNTIGYLTGLAANQQSAQQQGDSRKLSLLNQVMGVSESDLNFYNALRTGTLASATHTGPYNYGWPQAAEGIAQLVKTVASVGAGAAASAGGGAGGMGMGADYGVTGGEAGDYGMSGAGSLAGGAAGDYGMSYGGLNGGISNAGMAGGAGTWQGALQGYASGGVMGALGGYYGTGSSPQALGAYFAGGY